VVDTLSGSFNLHQLRNADGQASIRENAPAGRRWQTYQRRRESPLRPAPLSADGDEMGGGDVEQASRAWRTVGPRSCSVRGAIGRDGLLAWSQPRATACAVRGATSKSSARRPCPPVIKVGVEPEAVHEVLVSRLELTACRVERSSGQRSTWPIDASFPGCRFSVRNQDFNPT
jgi:hypothetical protein